MSQCAARVAPRANVEVPPHPGRIRSHLRIRNPSKSLQIQQPQGDENGDPTGRCPTRRGKPNPTGGLVIGWGLGLMESAHGESCTSGQRQGPAAQWSHPRIINPSISLQLQTRTKTVIPRVNTAPHGVQTSTQGTLLLIGVREASGPHPMGTRSSASSSTVIEYYCTATCC